MERSRQYQISYIFLCIFLLTNFIFSQTPTPTPIIEKSPAEIAQNEADLIHIGDLIDVDVIGNTEYDWRGSLNPEGFLNGVDFVEEPIFALCRDEKTVAAEIAKGYSKFLRNPQVRVRILDRSKRPLASLFGAIKTPQRFQIKRPIFLNELIVVSGGFTDKVSGEIQIFRQQNLNCFQALNINNAETFVTAKQTVGSTYINIRISDLLTGKQEFNPVILDGDVITVLEAQPIYIMGGVSNPKQISSRLHISLTRAIDSAGGLIKNADPTKITIFRRDGGETKIIEADLEKINTRQTADIILQAFDVVEVSQSGRDKRRFPPIIKVIDGYEQNSDKLPLRIID